MQILQIHWILLKTKQNVLKNTVFIYCFEIIFWSWSDFSTALMWCNETVLKTTWHLWKHKLYFMNKAHIISVLMNLFVFFRIYVYIIHTCNTFNFLILFLFSWHIIFGVNNFKWDSNSNLKLLLLCGIFIMLWILNDLVICFSLQDLLSSVQKIKSEPDVGNYSLPSLTSALPLHTHGKWDYLRSLIIVIINWQ